MRIRVAVVEDNAELREGLARLIDGGSSTACAGVYGRCDELLAVLPVVRPDVVVMDIGLPGMSGIEGVSKIKSLAPETEIVMVTVYEDEENIFQAIRAGASGYLLKKTLPGGLLDAIAEIYAGGAPMTASIARKVLAAFQGNAPSPASDSTLSLREREILSALVNGQSYKMIADSCFISIDTVRSHIKSIYGKLQVHSKAEAVAAALKNRLV
ncbi:MAG TPA: response regulator transcription factor [Bacteroidota bacterium]|nr:response regulator transcription factor [Bacteroidota bacterium]